MRLLDIDEKNLELMKEKLRQAQDLLSDVYHYANENNIESVESAMSCADSCIIESLAYLEV